MISAGWCCALLVLLVQALDVSLSYNLDVFPEKIFVYENSSFGYRVRQIRSTNGERILVGDPNLGLLHSCDVIGGSCDIITLPNQSRDNHIGLTLEVEPKSGRSIVCGSDIPRECDQMLYMNGLCYMMDASLTSYQKLTPGYQECQKADVDLCFLFDGSDSSGQPELNSIKHFLKNAVKNLRNTTVNFAIVQFSKSIRIELDFSQYQKFDNLTEVIDSLTLLGGGTRTFRNIDRTVSHIFTEKAGHRPRAKKVLLILTDGEATDQKGGFLDQADKMGVRRYLIGVGNNFNTSEQAKKQMEELASKPTHLHTRVLNNFKELENLFSELQQKILAIEGVQTCAAGSGGVCIGPTNETSFYQELSSAGLSAALTPEEQLLGDPGIFDWSGGILDISGSEKLINVSLQEDDKYGYLGYSVEVLKVPEGVFYVAGAPRYQYVGLVTVFKETADEAERIQNISGNQVGSYFGSEIEVCDTDQDGHSDVVLIAAPHFYDVRWCGQVSVYQYIQGRLALQDVLHGDSGHLHSQFGAAISALGDLDGDGFSDVAVGAPYEMGGRGVLYIFRGEARGVNTQYMQRLTAPAGSSGFGVSVHGVMDMTRDGLTDVAVGAAGNVTLYRSQPLLDVSVTMTPIPLDIPIPTVESATCENEGILLICVKPQILTTRYTGSLDVSLQYAVSLDFGRPVSRLSFINHQREMNQTFVLEKDEQVCRNHSIYLDCFLDDYSPVLVSLEASQISDDSRWLLSPSSSLTNITKIPFQLCGSGGSCEPDFHLNLTVETFVVMEGASFSAFLKLQNKGANAQRVKLQATYPAGLSVRKVNITASSRRMLLLCEDSETQSLSCNISHPIMRQASWADIHIMFGIPTNVSWPDRVQLTLHVTSENDVNVTNLKNMVTRDIPILYPINIITRRVENSTKYLQFIEEKEQSDVIHAYQIRNLGVSPTHTEFSVTVMIPAMVMGDLIWDYCVTSWVSHGNCTQLDHCQAPPGATEPPGNKTFLCTVKQHGSITIHVAGILRPTRAWKVTKSVNVSTSVTVVYNETRFHSQLGKKFHHAQVMTQVDLVVLPDYVPYIAGGTVGGVVLLLLICVLLYKCGFFKRYKDRMEEDCLFTDAQQPMKNEEKTVGTTEGPQDPLTLFPELADLLPETSEGQPTSEKVLDVQDLK